MHHHKTSLVFRLSTTTLGSSPKLQLRRPAILGGHQALVAEQQGRGGSLIRDLRLLGKKFSKPASSNLVAKDGRVLQSDGDKLNRWAEHFQEVVNCQINIDVIPIEDLPIVTPHSSSDTTLSDHDLSSPLSEEEIITAISELRAGKAPGPDGVSLEMLSLRGEATICMQPAFVLPTLALLLLLRHTETLRQVLCHQWRSSGLCVGTYSFQLLL